MARLAIAGLSAMLAVGSPASAQTATESLCNFIKIVLDAKPTGFETLKGDAQNPAVFKNEVFHGALLPNHEANCTLFLKSQAGRVTLPPRYSCTLAQEADFNAANRIFARAAQDLRACFPGAMFSIMYDGDGKDLNESFDWIVSAQGEGFRLELEMSNGILALADALSQNNANAPPIAIDLDITDTSEAR